MIVFSAEQVVTAIENACDGIWDRTYRDGWKDEANMSSPATKGDVIELMQSIVANLKECKTVGVGGCGPPD